MRSPRDYTEEERKMAGDIPEAPESTIEPTIDDSEYQLKHAWDEIDRGPKTEWFLKGADWDFNLSGWLAFAIGALCSSIIWFAFLLWLVEL